MSHQGVPLLLVDAEPPLEIGYEVVAPVFDGGRFGVVPVEKRRHGDGATAQSLLKVMVML